MPTATKTSAASGLDTFARTSARDIVARAKKAAGPMWNRLAPEGQLVETKAILCDDMLRDRAGTTLEWWLAVQRAVMDIIIPSAE